MFWGWKHLKFVVLWCYLHCCRRGFLVVQAMLEEQLSSMTTSQILCLTHMQATTPAQALDWAYDRPLSKPKVFYPSLTPCPHNDNPTCGVASQMPMEPATQDSKVKNGSTLLSTNVAASLSSSASMPSTAGQYNAGLGVPDVISPSTLTSAGGAHGPFTTAHHGSVASSAEVASIALQPSPDADSNENCIKASSNQQPSAASSMVLPENAMALGQASDLAREGSACLDVRIVDPCNEDSRVGSRSLNLLTNCRKGGTAWKSVGCERDVEVGRLPSRLFCLAHYHKMLWPEWFSCSYFVQQYFWWRWNESPL